ncbi:hypothetical protein [Candidatus Methylocalor cossyra]|uniref:Uncharacterized protein n=1 Tax=Candidatus Methylocalor cossyra TaxID=3108543 RepID=A0ABM9NH81_9GAMM
MHWSKTVGLFFLSFLLLWAGIPQGYGEDAGTPTMDEGDFEDDEDDEDVGETPQERIDRLRGWLNQRNLERRGGDSAAPEGTGGADGRGYSFDAEQDYGRRAVAYPRHLRHAHRHHPRIRAGRSHAHHRSHAHYRRAVQHRHSARRHPARRVHASHRPISHRKLAHTHAARFRVVRR